MPSACTLMYPPVYAAPVCLVVALYLRCTCSAAGGVGVASCVPCLHCCCCSCCEASRWLCISLVSWALFSPWAKQLHWLLHHCTNLFEPKQTRSSAAAAGRARTLAPALGTAGSIPLASTKTQTNPTKGLTLHTQKTPAAGWRSRATCSLLSPSLPSCHRLPASVRTSLRTSACQLASRSASAGGASTATVGFV